MSLSLHKLFVTTALALTMTAGAFGQKTKPTAPAQNLPKNVSKVISGNARYSIGQDSVSNGREYYHIETFTDQNDQPNWHKKVAATVTSDSTLRKICVDSLDDNHRIIVDYSSGKPVYTVEQDLPQPVLEYLSDIGTNNKFDETSAYAVYQINEKGKQLGLPEIKINFKKEKTRKSDGNTIKITTALAKNGSNFNNSYVSTISDDLTEKGINTANINRATISNANDTLAKIANQLENKDYNQSIITNAQKAIINFFEIVGDKFPALAKAKKLTESKTDTTVQAKVSTPTDKIAPADSNQNIKPIISKLEVNIKDTTALPQPRLGKLVKGKTYTHNGNDVPIYEQEGINGEPNSYFISYNGFKEIGHIKVHPNGKLVAADLPTNYDGMRIKVNEQGQLQAQLDLRNAKKVKNQARDHISEQMQRVATYTGQPKANLSLAITEENEITALIGNNVLYQNLNVAKGAEIGKLMDLASGWNNEERAFNTSYNLPREDGSHGVGCGKIGNKPGIGPQGYYLADDIANGALAPIVNAGKAALASVQQLITDLTPKPTSTTKHAPR